ncbi:MULTISPECIES: PhzF family phenazine biosynthesis protein [Halorubrum]|uniref:Phenazine biosynthesis protein PhzF family n=1 Tax=Halorubrum hochstenium ATCC 700873 TaxID=1227481 RepID=M0FPV1_9EURY|nr:MULTISPECIES: PhzF family phenazine biosynthesis protein [Halorubrum]ELZ60609.1 phenazine biosynthesis protein PhzF family [Halorubrum hochstenium ATCC 700873]
METRRALLVDAFAAEPLAGNAAGILLDAEGLSDDQMAAVAAELGASETAFRTDGDGATDAGEESDDGEAVDDRLRYFSPSTEVDLCGHATVATYGALFAEGAIDGGERTLRTNVGELTVSVDDDGTVWMRQQAPSVEVVEVDAGRLGAALGIDPAALRDVGADLPVAVASTGLPFLVVPVNFLERLGEADPDDEAIERLSEEFDAAGVYAFTFDTLEGDSTLHGRAFVPSLGISEDPVTGTASGAVGGYLRHVDAFDGDEPDGLRFEQGHFLDRPGHVRVRVEADGVRVGGRTSVALDGEIRIPDDDEDEIIEA